MSPWPTQANVDIFYGNPRGRGGAIVGHSWYYGNIVFIKPPFSMVMDGPVRRIPVHRRCAEGFNTWLFEVWRNSGRDTRVIKAWGMDVFSGSYCYRPMRGLNKLSMHSYGCAMDFDAPRNELGDRTPNFANFREEVVAPFLKLGGTWGGDWNGDGQSSDERRCDGMHFQFAR